MGEFSRGTPVAPSGQLGKPVVSEVAISTSQEAPVQTPAQPKELSAADRAVAKALEHIAFAEQDLLVAGVTDEQIQSARVRAEERVRLRFKELESQDPLSLIDIALREAAQTEQEQTLVGFNIRDHGYKRQLLVAAAKDPSKIEGGHLLDWRRDADQRATPHVVFPVLVGPYRDPESGEVYAEVPSHELQERFLQRLGVLEEGQSLNDLLQRSFPQYDKTHSSDPTPTGPLREVIRSRHFVTQLPTNIDGVQAMIGLSEPGIEISISPQALPKIQPPVAKV